MPLKLGSNWKSCGPLYDMRRFMHGNTRVNIMMMTMKIRASKSVVIMSDDGDDDDGHDDDSDGDLTIYSNSCRSTLVSAKATTTSVAGRGKSWTTSSKAWESR